MVSEREMSAAVGSTAYGSDGGKLGTVMAFFADDRTGEPTWVAVSTGLLGTRQSVVPVAGATFSDGALRLPVTADAVKSAPPMGGDHLDPADEEALRRHYEVGGEDVGGPQPVAAPPAEAAPTVDPASGAAAPPLEAAPTVQMAAPVASPSEPPAPAAEPAGSDGGMTRSEEQLRVGTERVATTRARLVKYIVTEDVQITVPIRREEIRVEEVPLDAVDDGPGESLDVPAGTEAASAVPGEIVLHTERPVVSVEVVPVERVRLRVDVVEGQETVTGQVQREQIVVDQDTMPGVSPR
jgi:uncharacterized protein (TIGR02271 family)